MNGSLLAPLAAAYGAAVSARAALYSRGWLRSVRASVPVVSVGNLTVGGTGKTPVVALVAKLLRDEGLRPAVISRGYGGKRREDPLAVSDGEGVPAATPAEAGDEPWMLARALAGVPVVVARRRAEGARLAVARLGARCLVLDDGFQHLALERDLDLVLLDGSRPFGDGRLLPSGYLREPPRALARAGALLLSGAAEAANGNGKGRVEALRSFTRAGTPVYRVAFSARALAEPGGGTRDIGWLHGRRVLAFAGIARPERFADTLEKLGAGLAGFRSFPDHHVYTRAEARTLLEQSAAARAEALVTTEKDLARMAGSPAGDLLREGGVLGLEGAAVVDPEHAGAFRELVLAAARGARGPEAR